MISSIEWIPRGVANPNPKKYSLSKAESEFLEQVANDFDMKVSVSDDQQQIHEIDQQSSQSEASDDDELIENLQNDHRQENIQKLLQALPAVDPSTLPAELKMGEYSDDDEDLNEHKIGQVLLGSIETDRNYGDIEFNADEEEDDDDSLQDVPDTREYIPTDVKGLEAMRFSGYTGLADYQDNMDDDSDGVDEGSDVEDTNLRPDDALILVAKTEEVRLHAFIFCALFFFLSYLTMLFIGLCIARNTCV